MEEIEFHQPCTLPIAKLQGKDFSFFITTTPCTIGRTRKQLETDDFIPITKDDVTVSREHAKIYVDKNTLKYRIECLGRTMIVNHVLYKHGYSAPLSQFCPIQIGDIVFYIVFPIAAKEANKLKHDFDKLKIYLPEILENNSNTLSIDEITSILKIKYNEYKNYSNTHLCNLILQASRKLQETIKVDENDNCCIYLYFY